MPGVSRTPIQGSLPTCPPSPERGSAACRALAGEEEGAAPRAAEEQRGPGSEGDRAGTGLSSRHTTRQPSTCPALHTHPGNGPWFLIPSPTGRLSLSCVVPPLPGQGTPRGERLPPRVPHPEKGLPVPVTQL